MYNEGGIVIVVNVCYMIVFEVFVFVCDYGENEKNYFKVGICFILF